jgi:hypothetical protein
LNLTIIIFTIRKSSHKMMNVKAKEAQPILRRSHHMFRIITLYVVDKFNFKLEK